LRRIKDIRPLRFEDGYLYVINQLKLPQDLQWVKLTSIEDYEKAIKDMVVRGAPLIGIVGAYGFYQGIKDGLDYTEVYQKLRETRPTAVNLFWALDRMLSFYKKYKEDENILEKLLKEAQRIELEDYHANKMIGGYGEVLLPKKANVLTHCNTGALATSGWGTALGVIRSAWENGKDITVFVDETRPYLQGSRLTAWELLEEGIPHYIITDSSAGFLISQRKVDAIIVGADRITSNGDTANKIGTYTLSVLAKYNKIPFYIAAPTSTFDLSIEKGEDIPIEERSEAEVKNCHCCIVAPKNSKALNYSFDITPSENITAIITEKGIIENPNKEKILKFFGRK
jgi:methylthioribose-1-phosphate isomerase